MGRQRPAAYFIGLDLSQRMLAIAGDNRLKAGWPSERLSLLRADAFQLPLVDGGLDAITGHSFLYLLPHRRVALAEAKRILRPGGYVAFLEPHAGQVNWSWLLGQVSIRLLTSISLWRLYSWLHARFSAESLGLTLQEAGFVNVTTEVTLGGFGIFGRAQKP
jgi:ubiquinone/menaquinone biosynthesis C-methylase UbiE